MYSHYILPGKKGASPVATGVITICAFLAKRTSCSRSGLDQHQHRLAQVACSSCTQLRPPRHNLLLCLHTCPSLKPSPTLIQEVYFLLVYATTFSSSPSLADSALFASLKQYNISRHTVTHEMRCSILKGHRCAIQVCV